MYAPLGIRSANGFSKRRGGRELSGIRAEHFDVTKWLDLISDGTAQLPEFQRDFVWKPDKTVKFLNAILEERPVGFLLVLKVNASGDAPFNPRVVEGATPWSDKPIEYLILDGQQRITSLWNALMDNSSKGRKFFVSYPALVESPEGLVSSMTPRKWHDDPKACLRKGLIPISLLRHTRSQKDRVEIERWVDLALADQSGNANLRDQRRLEGWIGDCGERLRTFHIPHLLMPEDTDPSKAIETFIEANTTSVNLKKFDIATAQNLASDGSKNLRTARDLAFNSVEGLDQYIDVPTAGDLILKIACLRCGLPPVESKFRDSKVLADVNTNSDKIVDGIRWVVELLQEDRIWDRRRLPSVVPFRVLPPLHRYYAEAPRQQGNIRKIARAYLWRAFLTDRYKSAAATLLKEDHDGLKRVIVDNRIPKKEVPIWGYRLPTLEQIRRAAWPTKTTLGKAVLAISLRKGAKDISSGDELRSTNLRGREYHHLFPDSYLGKSAPKANRHVAMNCILIEGRTNRAAGDKPPLEYLQSLAVREAGSRITSKDLKNRLNTHLVPMEFLDVKNQRVGAAYVAFTTKRAHLLKKDIEALVNGSDP